MHRDDPHRRLAESVGEVLREAGMAQEECKALLGLLPRKWERFSDVVLLPSSAFRGEWGTHCSDGLWRAVADALNAQRVARLGEIDGVMRESSVDMLLGRSEEYTSELQSLVKLVCRLLLENKHTHTFT